MKSPSPTSIKSSPSRRTPLALSLLILVTVFIAYLPALNGGFVWDDDSWTTNIAPLMQDAGGLLRMWTQPTALQQYYPLSGSSFWLDHQFWGTWTLPYHVENLLLHLLSAWLFWRLLLCLHFRNAWLAAAIFALHPVMVESVAWITERKNVLSMALFLAAALHYGRFTGFWQSDTPKGSRRSWWAALIFFIAAMLAKITAVVLPPVLLLLVWWQTGRLRWREDIRPILPFFLPAIALGLAVAILEKHYLGAIGPEWDFSLAQRCIIAGKALCFYFTKLLWPVGLCFIYPRWQPDTGSLLQWLPFTAAGVIFLGSWLLRGRWGRGPATALFYFAGTLFPMLGFMNAYGMRFSFVADHWVYLSSLGLIALITGLLSELAEKLHRPRLPHLTALIILPLLAAITWHEAHQYRDMETLWRTTLKKNPRSWMSHHNLGVLLQAQGHLAEAAACYQKVVELKPDHYETQLNYANILVATGYPKEALSHYEKSLALRPDSPDTCYALACALLKLGRFEDASTRLRSALQHNTERADMWSALGSARFYAGDAQEAVTCYEKALKLTPDHVDTLNNLGNTLMTLHREHDAIVYFQKATAADPRATSAHISLGNAFRILHRYREARAELETALTLQPGNITLLMQYAWLLATCPDDATRDGNQALALARQAVQNTGGNQPIILQALAAAYAETKHFPEAITVAEKALDLAKRQSGNSALSTQLTEQLRLYRLSQPLRDPAAR